MQTLPGYLSDLRVVPLQGAVLLQKDMQTNLWYPVAFFSKSLDVHERNYEIYDKELLVVI